VLGFGTLAAVLAFDLSSRFEPEQSTALQYKLIMRSYLASNIIQTLLIAKLIIFPLFVFCMDGLSIFIPGAMCAVGVISASSFGPPLLLLKLSMLYFMGLWILVHREDGKTHDYAFSVFKFKLFLVIYLGLVVEDIGSLLYFLDLDLQKIVSCCGTLFNPLSSTLGGRLLQIPNEILLPSLFVAFLITLYAAIKKDALVSGISNVLFLILGLITIISFFSTYVYELPSHQCPFCLLQKEYFYMGYLLYPALLTGSFFGVAPLFIKLTIKEELDTFSLAIFLNLFFILFASSYPIIYFLRNGVWL
jgi:hypothetical protein